MSINNNTNDFNTILSNISNAIININNINNYIYDYNILNNFIILMNNRIERNNMRDYILAEIDYLIWLKRPEDTIYTNNYEIIMINNLNHYRSIIFNNNNLDLMNEFLISIDSSNYDELKEMYNHINSLYRV